ncbi:hypothetical protein CJ030_MR0G006840 [Morella rubra]|uniref:Uncharacterized protein n=1 Tax=Morella rubra TaxID=262757 RepID=A0A6A1UKZ2_9ROSI|nr:hypothetical protein CJ030_MR0G006840 [Morella rubra]
MSAHLLCNGQDESLFDHFTGVDSRLGVYAARDNALFDLVLSGVDSRLWVYAARDNALFDLVLSGVKVFERLVSGQAPVRSAIENMFDETEFYCMRVRMMTVQTWEMTGDMRLECENEISLRKLELHISWRDNGQRAVAPCPSSPPPVFNDVAATTSCRRRSQLVPVMPAPTPSTPASGDFETRASSQPTLAPSLGGMTHSSTGCKLMRFLQSAKSTSHIGNFPSVTSEIGPAELYAASHKRKNRDWFFDVTKDNHVLGPKPGYVRGLGRAVKPPRSSGSTSTSVARQLREAQLEIDRLKAKREAEIEQMRIEREAEMVRMRAERQQEMKELENRLMREMRERMNDFMTNSSHGL